MAFLAAVVFVSVPALADTIPSSDKVISVTPQRDLPMFQEIGKAGAKKFILTVTNVSKNQIIGFKHNPIAAAIISQVQIGHVDASDTLVAPMAYSATTCIKPNGNPVLLNPRDTCTFTYDLIPVAGDPCPGKKEDPCDSGATTIEFTVNPSLGGPESTEPTFIVEDVPKSTAEPTSLILLAFGVLGLAGWHRLRGR